MMTPSQINGFDSLPNRVETERTTLVPFTAELISDDYLSWFRDDDVTRHLDSRNLTRSDVIEHLERGLKNREYRIYAICLKDSGRHIGNVKLGPILWRHGVSDLVTVIGDRHSWGKGLATEVIAAAVRVAFDHLKLRKLSAGINWGNEGSVKAYTRAGWVVEAVLEGQVISDGQVRDKIVIGCFNPIHFPNQQRSKTGIHGGACVCTRSEGDS